MKTKPLWHRGECIADQRGWVNPQNNEVLVAIGNLKEKLEAEGIDLSEPEVVKVEKPIKVKEVEKEVQKELSKKERKDQARAEYLDRIELQTTITKIEKKDAEMKTVAEATEVKPQNIIGEVVEQDPAKKIIAEVVEYKITTPIIAE